MVESNALITSAGFKDLSATYTAGIHLFAEIVMINHSDQPRESFLYELKKEPFAQESEMSALKDDILALERHPNLMMGKVVSIDKKLKQITLENQNIVSYKHLIAYSRGLKSNEYTSGLQTLFYGLLLSKKIPNNQNEQAEARSNPANFSSEQAVTSDLLEKFFHQKLHENENQSSSNLIDSVKKLCEVQT